MRRRDDERRHPYWARDDFVTELPLEAQQEFPTLSRLAISLPTPAPEQASEQRKRDCVPRTKERPGRKGIEEKGAVGKRGVPVRV